MRKFVHGYIMFICVRTYKGCVSAPYDCVRSLRKFQFPWDKPHFTANLFPALVLRKPGMSTSPLF